MVCNNCGTQVPDGSNVCPFCGGQLIQETQQDTFDDGGFTFGGNEGMPNQQYVNNTPQTHMKKVSTKLLWSLFGGILVASFLSIFALVGDFVKTVNEGIDEIAGIKSEFEQNVDEELTNFEDSLDEELNNFEDSVNEARDDLSNVAEDTQKQPVANESTGSSVTKDNVTISIGEVSFDGENTLIDLSVKNEGNSDVTVDSWSALLVSQGEQFDTKITLEDGELNYNELKAGASISGYIAFEGNKDIVSGDKLYINVLNRDTFKTQEFVLTFE